ncbi:CHAT domain-containing protein [Phlebopus sp. FC_14]|nr:CHAT domain-containing protein [Phlebopus sp. FC_14]
MIVDSALAAELDSVSILLGPDNKVRPLNPDIDDPVPMKLFLRARSIDSSADVVRVKLTVIQLTGLPERFGRTNERAFVMVELDRQSQMTAGILPNECNVEWNETFDLSAPSSSQIFLSVFFPEDDHPLVAGAQLTVLNLLTPQSTSSPNAFGIRPPRITDFCSLAQPHLLFVVLTLEYRTPHREPEVHLSVAQPSSGGFMDFTFSALSRLTSWQTQFARGRVNAERLESLNQRSLDLRRRFQEASRMKKVIGLISTDSILRDLSTTVQLRREAMDLTAPLNSNDWYLSHCLALVAALFQRHAAQGNALDLDEGIDIANAALSAAFTRDIRSNLLHLLCYALLLRVRSAAIPSDIGEAVRRARELVELRPHGHPNRCPSLLLLCQSLSNTFSSQALRSDVEDCIRFAQEAVSLAAPGGEEYQKGLALLFGAVSTLSDKNLIIEQCRVHLKSPSALSPTSPLYVLACNLLAETLIKRFSEHGDKADLDEAIGIATGTVQATVTPSDHIAPLRLLCGALILRCSLATSASLDIEEAIRRGKELLELTPQGHPARSQSLFLLIKSLLLSFVRNGLQSDLLQSIICLGQEGITLVPLGSPEHDTVYQAYFLAVSHLPDVDEVIRLLQKATLMNPPLPSCIVPSFSRLLARLLRSDDQEDFGRIVSIATILLGAEKILQNPPHHRLLLLTLCAALHLRSIVASIPTDPDESVRRAKELLELTPSGHPDHLESLFILEKALDVAYFRHGHQADLDSCIQVAREALGLTPVGHPKRLQALKLLQSALARRYKNRLGMADLAERRQLSQEILALSAHADGLSIFASVESDVQRLTVIGTPFTDTVRRLMEADASSVGVAVPGDLVSLHRRIVDSWPPNSINRVGVIYDLAVSLLTRFRLHHAEPDITEAVKLLENCLSLTTHEHSSRMLLLDHLGLALSERFSVTRQQGDLDRAIHLFEQAVELAANSSYYWNALFHLTFALIKRENLDGSAPYADKDKIISLLSQLSSREPGSSSLMYSVLAALWADVAEQVNHPSALDAYRVSLILRDQFITTIPSAQARHRSLNRVTAVELLEQGRGLVWAQLSRLRQPLMELSDSGERGKALAEELLQLGAALRDSAASVTNMERIGTHNGVDDEVQHNARLARWDALINEIRQVAGFSRFLLPPEFSDLRHAAVEGPVVIVNASKRSCDAVIVSYAGEPIHVPLVITFIQIGMLSTHFSRLTQDRVMDSEERRRALIYGLRELWKLVVCPVVERLKGGLDLPRGSRIWWCPTSKFSALPLHAAGPYERGEPNLDRIYVSSYTPTLSALIRARANLQTTPIMSAPETSFLAIGQSNPTHGRPLVAVEQELNLVEDMCPPSMGFTRAQGEEATDTLVLEALRTHAWAHFACHGKQDLEEPLNSAFAMRNGPLALHRIAHADLRNLKFAFLSACHTAGVDETAPDEVIHLAAGLQFAGPPSVIGTLWAVMDETAPLMVEQFYKHMFESGVMDCTQAARSLNKATKTVDKRVPLEQRVAFIHIGV